MPVTVCLSAAGTLPGELRELRLQVRTFLEAEIASGAIRPAADAWMSGVDIGLSQRLAERGWVGMTIPVQYGGRGRSALERYVVTEELLAAGAPVGAHWIADRQMAPSILRNGTEQQKRAYLPKIATAEAFFAIGMSEPDSGSDLASVRTRARLTTDGWRLSGTKLWTSLAHIATAMVVLARTDDVTGADGKPSRHAGLSQFIVDLPNPGVRISPVVTIDGAHHFNEVVFDDALIPESALLGKRGDGWRQVTAELGNERSGPERILSTMPVLAAWAGARPPGESARADLGRLTARVAVLRQLSAAVAGELDRGGNPATHAALVKDLGTRFEGEVVDVISGHVGAGDEPLAALVGRATLHVPAFTLRGGTTEVLRGIVAKELLRASRTATSPGQASDQRKEIAEAVRGVLRAAPCSWKDVAGLGFTALTVPEELGGSGGNLRDAAVVVAEAARHHVALPIAEANFLAGPLLAAAGIELPDGILTGTAGTVAVDRAWQAHRHRARCPMAPRRRLPGDAGRYRGRAGRGTPARDGSRPLGHSGCQPGRGAPGHRGPPQRSRRAPGAAWGEGGSRPGRGDWRLGGHGRTAWRGRAGGADRRRGAGGARPGGKVCRRAGAVRPDD